MTAADAERWDRRWARESTVTEPAWPTVFDRVVPLLPDAGQALELACGLGAAAVWLARRGWHVDAVDASPIAVGRAAQLARTSGVAHRCRFTVHDLDAGLPDGQPVDLALCHMFREPALDHALIRRLAPGGLLCIAVLSEVGAAPGAFRSAPGELTEAFDVLDIIDAGEGEGRAWLVARQPAAATS